MRRLLATPVLMTLAGCSPAKASEDPFVGPEQALSFAATVSPLFVGVTGMDSQPPFDGYQVVRRTFAAGEKIAALDLTLGPDGQIVIIEVRFPVIDGECHRTPPADDLARVALQATEPVLARDEKNVRLVSSLVGWGWPRRGASSPAAKVGRTLYGFRRLGSFCTMVVERPWVPTRPV